MSVYMITYFISDTHGHSHDHDENCGCNEEHSHEHVHGDVNIVGKIKSLGTWAQFLPEGFFVKTDSSAEEIFTEVSSVANKGDIIFVTKVDAKTSACANPAVLEWLED
ncbi:hypothetical protein CDLVIII_2128 [Clostridium sp. DL-VIII]|uniref:hypothetical protein n=1 Tax=Clostridium sp. DL-VIII TaxID=641107 RepID=UPI00023AFADC|nr:hypothetical protein [Clostridium sp. DL-VIII]EHI98791.1 hypothetical protein CDLVIII_2128 [Clostridium sp. DL-VIII]